MAYNLILFLENIVLNGSKKIYVGYSGGLDSTVLLHILSKIAKNKIFPIHINHNIKNYSIMCEKHCLNFSESIGLNLIIDNIKKLNIKTNCIESRFRIARHKCFFRRISKNSVLLLAHHEQDLIETYLFRLFKGSGFNGLSSIKSVNNIFGIKCVRPLLIFDKKTLYKYAVFNRLTWCEDPTNKSLLIARNYIRHKILKNISMFWPSAYSSSCA